MGKIAINTCGAHLSCFAEPFPVVLLLSNPTPVLTMLLSRLFWHQSILYGTDKITGNRQHR